MCSHEPGAANPEPDVLSQTPEQPTPTATPGTPAPGPNLALPVVQASTAIKSDLARLQQRDRLETPPVKSKNPDASETITTAAAAAGKDPSHNWFDVQKQQKGKAHPAAAGPAASIERKPRKLRGG